MLPRKSTHKGFKPRAKRMSRGQAQLERKGNYGGKLSTLKRSRIQERPYHSVNRKCGLRDALDIEVSLEVRTNHPACVLCGESDWQKLTCGHLFKRTKEATRFDTHEGGNCSTLCKECNDRDNRKHSIYVDWFKKTYGEKAYAELEARARSKRRFEPFELRAMLDDLRGRKAA